MIVTNHWMGAVYGSVLHVTGVDLTAPSQNCMQPAQLQTQTQTQTQTTHSDLLIDMFELYVHIYYAHAIITRGAK